MYNKEIALFVLAFPSLPDELFVNYSLSRMIQLVRRGSAFLIDDEYQM